MVYRVAALATFLIAISTLVGAQSFRGEVVPREVPAPDESTTVTLSGGQVAVLAVPPDHIFTSGIDVTVRPTDGAAPQPGAFTIAVYAAVDAPSGEGIVNIGGSLQERIPIGNTSSLSVAIPFRGAAPSAPSAGTRVIAPIDPAIGPIGIQIVPSAKGMSAEVAATRFEVEIRP